MQTRLSARKNTRRLLLVGALVLPAIISMSGCWHNEAGPGYSNDSHTYVSTAWRPWTVTLVDTRTGEAVWSVDVPVDQQLSLRFRNGGPSDELPDMMDWGLMDAGTKYGKRKNRLPVPGSDARVLRPTLRATPEMPGAILTSAPDVPDEIIETTPYEAPADEMIGAPDFEEPGDSDEVPIDLPDGA